MNRHAEVAFVLRTIGVPAHLSGYPMLKDAVELVMDNRTVLTQMNTAFYPPIAKRHDTTEKCAERNMRHCIEYTWKKGDQEKLRKLFARQKSRPTVSHFVATIAEEVKVFRLPELEVPDPYEPARSAT